MNGDTILGVIVMLVLLGFYFSDHTEYDNMHKKK